MSQRENWRIELLLMCLGFVAIAAFAAVVFYFLSWFVPYLVFYVLPFCLVSGACGYLVHLSSRNLKSRELNDGSHSESHIAISDYRRLAFSIPVIAMVGYLSFNFNPQRPVLIDPLTKEFLVLGFEWPKVNKAFNSVRTSVYRNAGFDSLREKARVSKPFDRADLGKVFWLSLVLGVPVMFFYYARRDEEFEQEIMEQRAHWILRAERALVETLKSQQTQKIEEARADLKRKIKELESRLLSLQNEKEQIACENQLLKAKMEFSPAAAIVMAKSLKTKEAGSSGVLDGELL